MRITYNILIKLYGLFISIASFFSPKAKKLRKGQSKVFSLLKKSLDKNDKTKTIWFHAASLGEFEQGRPVIESLKQSYPEYKILLTFFSPSGYEVRKDYKGADIVCYLPLDTTRNAKRFIELVKPEKIIFIKYEFWPNFLTYCKKKKISTYVISATFRETQLFFKWYGWSYARLLRFFDRIYVQDEHSKTLLKSINIRNVEVIGDTRFDRVIEICENSKEIPLIKNFKEDKDLIVAGSSWPKDEELILKYINYNKEVKLVLAPHDISESHLKQIEENLSVKSIRFSKANSDKLSDVRCVIIDSIGFLSSVYRYADIAYIGGGFGIGIHNILEPAVYYIPVVFGPNFGKFKEARDLVSNGGGFAISDYIDLRSSFDWLLEHKGAGQVAGDYVHSRKGATNKIVAGIFNQIENN